MLVGVDGVVVRGIVVGVFDIGGVVVVVSGGVFPDGRMKQKKNHFENEKTM